MPLQLPNLDPKRELARKLAESIISKIPLVGGPYVAMLSVTHRPEAEKKMAAWREDVTKSINEIEQVIVDLIPTIKLSDDASALGLWFAKISEQGRGDPVEFDSIRGAFPLATQLELEDACGELELEGLVNTSAAMAHKIRLVWPTNKLFEVFDPIAADGVNPRTDAAQLAKFILKQDRGATADAMIDHFGWPARRFNPAMAILCEMISEGRKSAEIHPDFVCRFIMPNSAERARFKRYVGLTLGE